MSPAPVLLVHGIWNTGAAFDALAMALSQRAKRDVSAPSLHPNDGRAPLPTLAAQLEPVAHELLARSGSEKIDVVGFSMGALVSRFWLQRLGGKGRVRRFVSIAGPHAGTYLAWASAFAGVRQMRPGSDFLLDLERDPDPFGGVEVHTLGTPYDLMIVPTSSSTRLSPCRGHTWISAPLHRGLLTDPRALAKVVAILDAP